MFKLIDKKIITILFYKNLLNWPYEWGHDPAIDMYIHSIVDQIQGGQLSDTDREV